MVATVRIALGLALTSLIPLWAGSLEGRVFEESEHPLPGVVIRLQDDFGWEATAVTDDQGFYRWDGLPDGWYTVSLIEPAGYRLVDPPCGYHDAYLSGTNTAEANFRMAARGSGVVVELGSPIGSIGGPLVLSGPYFNISVFAYNLNSFFPNAVDRLVIRGRWYIPGLGLLAAQAVGGVPAGSYNGTNLTVSYQNLTGNQVEIVLERNQWPYLSQDGEMAQLTFQILSEFSGNLSGKTVAFCIDDLSFHWRNTLRYWSTEYYLGTFQ